MEAGETVFFQANAIVLVLWGRAKLAADTGVEDSGTRWSGITLAHNVGSPDEVHAMIELAREQGAEISREPAETFYGGYAGVFRDLEREQQVFAGIAALSVFLVLMIRPRVELQSSP